MPDFSNLKLGCLPANLDDKLRTLKMDDYLTVPDLPALPERTNYLAKYPHPPMFLNDRMGCCTCATKAHMQMVWSANSGKHITLTDADVQAAYNRINGGADNGATLIDALNDWRTNPLAGDKLGAYAALQIEDPDDWRYASHLFGGAYSAVQLPLAWQQADVWDVSPGTRLTGPWKPGGWGGHCVPLVDFDADGIWTVTWGHKLLVTWRAIKYYFVEAYALLDNLLFSDGGKSISGFDADMLAWDMKAITGQDPGPKPTPPPPKPNPDNITDFGIGRIQSPGRDGYNWTIDFGKP